jgi:hypothetical protein
MDGGSEVAALRQKIEAECYAINLMLNGFAQVADHRTISHKYEALKQYQEQLGEIVGQQAAVEITTELYNRIIK